MWDSNAGLFSKQGQQTREGVPAAKRRRLALADANVAGREDNGAQHAQQPDEDLRRQRLEDVTLLDELLVQLDREQHVEVARQVVEARLPHWGDTRGATRVGDTCG